MWHTLGNSKQSKAAIIQQLRKREREMGRSPCSKEGLNKGAWTADEDKILREYLSVHGEGRWRNLPKKAGLKRCGKSCRLRWLNYLRPDIKRGNISPDEQDLIVRLHKLLGNRWSLIADRLPGRTDNEIKNYWNANLGKKVKDHSQTNTRPLRPNENNTKNPYASKLKLVSSVVRTKATKCSKVFLNPVLQHDHRSSMQWQNKSEAEADLPLLVDSASNSITTSNRMEPNTYEYDSGFLSFPPVEQQLTSDLLLGFNMGELCLPDLLNSDFSGTCDFSYSNNNSQGLSPSSDQPMVFSDEILKDSTQSGFDETNVSNNSQFLTSFLNSSEEWPGER